jgi:phage terminase Nu1 subunit (DNA packaging protein)
MTTNGVSATELARRFNLSPSRIYALAKLLNFPKAGPALFDLEPSTFKYICYIQGELERRGPSGGPQTKAILEQRLRVLTAQAVKFERENAIDRGEFISVVAVEKEWVRLLTNTRARILAIPSKMAPMLINRPEAAVIAAMLKAEVYTALTALASGAADNPSIEQNYEVEDDATAADEAVL